MTTTFEFDTSRFCDEVFDHLKSVLDVTVHLGGKTFFGNRLIMATMSSYFQQTLAGHPEQNPVINLSKGAAIDQEAFERIMEFLHKGFVSLDTEVQAGKFMSLARSLGVRNWYSLKSKPKLSLDLTLTSPVASTDPSEADTDIEDDNDDDGTEEVSTILRQISFAVSMSRSNNDNDSGVDSKSVADSLESSSKRPLAPIRAKRVKGICGDHWQCLDCQYWCYNDKDIRRHERRLRHVSEDAENNTQVSKVDFQLSNTDSEMTSNDSDKTITESSRVSETHSSKTTNTNSKMPMADSKMSKEDFRRLKSRAISKKYKLRARAQKLGGICGDYFQCQSCRYWNYSQEGVRIHQRRMRH